MSLMGKRLIGAQTQDSILGCLAFTGMQHISRRLLLVRGLPDTVVVRFDGIGIVQDHVSAIGALQDEYVGSRNIRTSFGGERTVKS